MRIPILALALSAMLLASIARAAEICVTSTADLEFALAVAEGNGEDDIIRLTTGNFDAPAGGFEYFAGETENFDLTISGGWSEFFGNPCGQQLEGAPATMINGQLTDRGLQVRMRDSGTLTISRLSFNNGYVADPFRGGGLWIRAEQGYSGTIFIERNLFFNNEAQYGGGLQVGITGSGLVQLHVTNNLFRFNRARVNHGAAELLLNGGQDSLFGARLAVVNNTIVSNFVDTSNSSSVGGLWVSGQVPAKYVINNNIWGNQELDLVVNPYSGTVFALYNNNFGTSSFNSPPTSQAGNISVQPEYEPCTGLLCFNGVPVPNTPLHDGGRGPGQLSPWSFGSADFRGRPRVNDASVDIGVFESHSLVFSDRFQQ